TISFGLRNVPRYEEVVKECSRVLKVGGKISILEASYPNSKWIRPFFKLYFKHIMPFMGRFFVKKMSEYQWLHDSTEVFLSKDALKTLLSESGFSDVLIKSLLFGSAAIHTGIKN
ncbi:MAG: class I SAM-dependent methyltransferase, partial [Fusobacteria bacterium]|nr:class I SAM-dependent methyltransferase [Fusobacteriota bacterium]